MTLTQQPTSPTSSTTATFAWKTSGSVTAVVCSEDGSPWAPCSSGITYKNVPVGSNTFSVKVSNGTGYRQAYAAWTVAAPATSTTSTTTTSTSTTSTTTTSTTTTSTTKANTFGSDMFGIAAGTIQNEDATTLARDLSSDQAAGSHWLRFDINWAQIQANGPSSYNWGPIDAEAQGAESRGMKLLGMIVYTPNWDRPAGTSATYGPSPSSYATFVSAAVAHYSAMGVHAYEIWNEPNATWGWTPAPNPAAYTAILKAAYSAVKAADPTATVVTGGLSPATSDGTNISTVDFLSGIYASGGHGYFDAVGQHPYCWPANPGDADTWSAWYQMYGTPTNLRSLMIANGDGDKKIWATEYGAPSNGPSSVSEATQASMISKAYQLWSGYSWAGPMFVYNGRDSGTDTSSNYNFFGLVRYDFSQKPAFAAYQKAVATY